MAHQKLSPQEFIQNSFCPLVAAMCSPLIEQTCRKNNLSFTEMVQPFCKLNTEANFRDPSGTMVTVKNLRICIADVNSRPPQPTVARKFLNESVSAFVAERTTVVEVGNMSLDVPVSVPWFEAWRETFLQVQFPSDHEFTKHYIACMLIVSSQETSPLDTLTQMSSQLQQMQSISPAKLPKWFSSTVLRYYVLLHDNTDGDTLLAESTFESIKNMYGVNNCFFLNINSQAPSQSSTQLADPWNQFLSKKLHSQESNELIVNLSDGKQMLNSYRDGYGGIEEAHEAGESINSSSVPVILHPLSPVVEQQVKTEGVVNSWSPNKYSNVHHGSCLTLEDLDKIRQFISDFITRCLIPYAESQIQQLTDIVSNKKGVSRSLLSATKRWFGSNKPALPSTPSSSLMYSSDCPELQLRRLGDLCFMFGAYSLAFTAYHSAKRDFNADAAWLHYAGALEMAALSMYMQGNDSSRKAHDYAEESIVTYLNTCRMPQFATRATLFSAECLKGRNLHGEAAKQLIRMTSEDSDLRSALLLEQAAYCFLNATRPQMPRKYAFHLVLAGHRFSKAGQRKHSLRCYRQAYQIYENKSWSLAEDHIHHTIGRQASTLKHTAEAAEAFARLLPRASRQAASQQATFIREYLSTQQQLSSETGEMPILPLPLVEGETIQVLLGGPPAAPLPSSTAIPATGVTFDQNHADNIRWWKLEEKLLVAASGSQPMVFKPTNELLNNHTNNTNSPVTYVEEPVNISVHLSNPLHISIPIREVHLLWSFIPVSGGLCQDNTVSSNSDIADTDIIDEITLLPDSTKQIILQIRPKQIGELRITGLAYILAGDTSGGISVAGKQLLIVRGPKLRPAKDKTPNDDPIYAIDNRLRLTVVESTAYLRVCFDGLKSEMLSGELIDVTVHMQNFGKLPVSRILLASTVSNLFSLGHTEGEVGSVPLKEPIAPGQSVHVPMKIRAPDIKGTSDIDFLFYYESLKEVTKSQYRLIRHSWPLMVYESVHVLATPTRSSATTENEQILNLQIQVRNNNNLHDPVMYEISLLQFSLFSENWCLTKVAFFPANVKLEAQEFVHLVLQAKHKPASQPQLSSVSLENSVALALSQDFLHVSASDTIVDGDESAAATDNTREQLLKDIEAAVILQATLILMWKAQAVEGGDDKQIAVGQHHVQLKKLGDISSWPPQPVSSSIPASPSLPLKIFGSEMEKSEQQTDTLSQKQWLLTFTLHYKSFVTHDFKKHRLCIVPVELHLQNCSDSDVVIRLEASGATTSYNKSQLYAPQPCSSFYWVGCTRRLLSLSPHSALAVHLSATVGGPGAYDLGSHLFVQARHLNDKNFIQQSWKSDALLIVS